MMKKEIVLYDNTNLYNNKEKIREELFEELADSQDWITSIDVPDSMVEDEIRRHDEEAWLDFKCSLIRMFKDGMFLLTGYCGRWDGRCEGGKFVKSYSDLMTCLEHLDGITFTDVNGHLIIEGYHHDGNDRYELKKLTSRGFEYANNNYFAHDRKLHQIIMNSNFFSCLPRLATI